MNSYWVSLLGCSLFFSTFQSFGAAPTDPLDEWTFVHPRGPLSPLGTVAYGNGRYVVVASDAARPQIMWSSNAVDWVASAANFPFYYSDVIFAEGKFWLAGGEDDAPAAILTSTNGADWSLVYSTNSHEFFARMRYANGTWIARAVDEDAPAQLMTADDGVDWAPVPAAPRLHYFDVTGGLWVGLRYEGTVYRSTNGVEWTTNGSLSEFNYIGGDSLFGLAAGNGTFVAFGSRLSAQPEGYFTAPLIVWSTDGLNWSNAVVPTLPPRTFWAARSMVYGTNGFVSVISDPDVVILRSVDGRSWQATQTDIYTSVGDLSFANGLYFLTGAEGVVFTSPDGITWTQRLGASTRQLRGLAEGNSGLVAVGNGGLLLTSIEGTNWTRHDGITKENLAGIIAQPDRYAIVGGTTNAVVLTSSNGSNWSSVSSSAHGPLQSATCGVGDLVLGVGLRGTIARITQNSVDFFESPAHQDFRSVAQWQGEFVAVASSTQYPESQNSGTIYTSSNGLDWTLRFTHSNGLYCVAASRSRVVAAGIYGVAFVSSNAVDWQPITIAGVPGNWMAQGHWLSLAFGDGVFVAVGIGGNHEGKLFSSINGSDWHAHEILPYPDSGSLPNVWNDAIIFGGAPWVAYSRDRFYSGVGPEYLWRSGRGVPRLHIPPHHPQQLSIRVAGVEDAVSRLQTSVDFMNWTDAGAVTNEPGGPLLLPINITEPQRFYRVISE